MTYRSYGLSLLLLGTVACGDDGGATTKIDAAANTEDAPSSVADAAIDAPPMMPDGGAGAACGMTTCTASEECCVGNGGDSTCVATGTCEGVSFSCDGPEDCDSTEACCYGNQGGGPGEGGSTCEPANQCQVNACHVDMDCSGQTTKCCAIANTPYKVCLAQCPTM